MFLFLNNTLFSTPKTFRDPVVLSSKQPFSGMSYLLAMFFPPSSKFLRPFDPSTLPGFAFSARQTHDKGELASRDSFKV